MKKISKKIVVLVLSLLLLTAGMAPAQQNAIKILDKITFVDGTTKEGKVIALSNEKVQFVHQGETLNYELDKSDILTIAYGSGRTESINRYTVDERDDPLSKERVAVLPIHYINGEMDNDMEEMEFVLQDIATEFLSRSAVKCKLMGPPEVNALLLRRGINRFSIRQFTPKELAAILNVEYIIMGNVLQEKGRMVTSGHNHTKRESFDRYNSHGNAKRRYHSSGLYITHQDFKTRVWLFIYNRTGETIYSHSRRSMLPNRDAYKHTIHYMLKRTPLYRR